MFSTVKITFEDGASFASGLEDFLAENSEMITPDEAEMLRAGTAIMLGGGGGVEVHVTPVRDAA